MWTCSSFAPSGVSLNNIRDPPEHVRGLRVRSLAVPTTTYHSTSLREAKVQTVTLGGTEKVRRIGRVRRVGKVGKARKVRRVEKGEEGREGLGGWGR